MSEVEEDVVVESPRRARLRHREAIVDRFLELFCEAMREAGLLWFVFANLNALVARVATTAINWPWHLISTAGAAIFWLIGASFDSVFMKGAER